MSFMIQQASLGLFMTVNMTVIWFYVRACVHMREGKERNRIIQGVLRSKQPKLGASTLTIFSAVLDWPTVHKGSPDSRVGKTDCTLQLQKGANCKRGVNTEREQMWPVL